MIYISLFLNYIEFRKEGFFFFVLLVAFFWGGGIHKYACIQTTNNEKQKHWVSEGLLLHVAAFISLAQYVLASFHYTLPPALCHPPSVAPIQWDFNFYYFYPMFINSKGVTRVY